MAALFGVPLDPTTPRDPMVIRRRRPDSVTLAGVVLYVAGALGIVAALALIVAASSVVNGFRLRAVELGSTGADVDHVSTAIRSALLSSGMAALVLAVMTVILARGVHTRNEVARIGALVVVVGSLACAMVRTSVTAFGRNIDWTAGIEDTTAALANNVSQAYGDAMPGWLVGLAGGLTDLQALGYILVAILLLLPVSQEYFRTRVTPTADSDPPLVR